MCVCVVGCNAKHFSGSAVANGLRVSVSGGAKQSSFRGREWGRGCVCLCRGVQSKAFFGVGSGERAACVCVGGCKAKHFRGRPWRTGCVCMYRGVQSNAFLGPAVAGRLRVYVSGGAMQSIFGVSSGGRAACVCVEGCKAKHFWGR